MRTRSLLAVVLVLAAVVGAVAFVVLDGTERSTVTFVDDADGTTLATVEVNVSDSWYERYVGLSNTESLDEDEGMLFVHSREADHGYVMRDMGFPIDMVFVAENGTITTIHHAELPPEGESSPTYRGHGKYVVELPYEYTLDHDIEVGDHVEGPEVTATDAGSGEQPTMTATDAVSGEQPTMTATDAGSGEQPTMTATDAGSGERTAVSFAAPGSDQTLATVEVTVSDTARERYTGLSDTESLGADEGMLFVHSREAIHGYVMRNMSFPIDMVFVAENGTITTIHHAQLPPAGEDSPTYEGYGKYVVELPYEYTLDHDIAVGDHVEIPEAHRDTETPSSTGTDAEA